MIAGPLTHPVPARCGKAAAIIPPFGSIEFDGEEIGPAIGNQRGHTS